MKDMIIQKGWNKKHSVELATLYEKAFGSKFSTAISNRQKRIDILFAAFMPVIFLYRSS